jgi:NAD(P)-dependent dehydrogenase (short-subunit alcohol dehydrogenase family)
MRRRRVERRGGAQADLRLAQRIRGPYDRRVRDLGGSVVVITGASSGLGREAAVQLAGRGCRVVLAARRPESLEETARLCREAGGQALVVVTDVTRQADVELLAEAAVAEWGRIDVWVNNAGVTMFSLLEEGPIEAHLRVIETNLIGPILAARAVIPIFRRQKHGILIDVGSIVSRIGQPFVPSYAISKFGLRGLTETLRIELADEPNIHVCSLLPYTMDTPHFEDGANETGWEPHGMAPVQSPEKVARALVGLIERPRRERYVPRHAVLGYAAHWMFPRTTERLILHVLERWHFAPVPEARSSGGLFCPVPTPGRVHGSRPPLIRAPALLVWAAVDLVRTEARAVRRQIRDELARLAGRRGAPAAHRGAPADK